MIHSPNPSQETHSVLVKLFKRLKNKKTTLPMLSCESFMALWFRCENYSALVKVSRSARLKLKGKMQKPVENYDISETIRLRRKWKEEPSRRKMKWRCYFKASQNVNCQITPCLRERGKIMNKNSLLAQIALYHLHQIHGTVLNILIHSFLILMLHKMPGRYVFIFGCLFTF